MVHEAHCSDTFPRQSGKHFVVTTKVERWVELCLITFLYLEWYRAEKLSRRDLSPEQKRWWYWQRTHGLCVAVRQETEDRELDRIAQYVKTKSGLRKLRKILRAARPTEQRQAA